LNVRSPRAAMLSVQVEIGLGNGVRVEASVGTLRRETLRATGWFVNAAVDHYLGDVDILWLKLPRHTLYQTSQPKLAYGKGWGVRIAFDARGSPGKQNRPVPGFDHPFRGRLSDKESAVASYHDRFAHLFGVQFDDRPANATAGVVDNQIRFAD